VSYFWSFGDGSNSTEQSPMHTYTHPGQFLVVLTVEDDDGEVARDDVFIKVLNRKPIIEVNLPETLTVSQAASFNGSASDLDGFITRYEWDFDGDGSFEWYALTTGITSHFYTEIGTYKPTFRVTDDRGGTNTTELTLVITDFPNNPPAANAGKDQRAGAGTLKFLGIGMDPDWNINLYEWDFNGDGTFDWSSKQNRVVNFTYLSEGTYTAVFRVTDEFGAQDEDSIEIIIDNKYHTDKVGAEINFVWDYSGSTSPEFNYIARFNNSVIPENVTVYVRALPSGRLEELKYSSELIQSDNRTINAPSSLTPGADERVIVEVFYFDQLVGHRELEISSDFQRQLLNPALNLNARYEYSTDLHIEDAETTRDETHAGELEVVQRNQLLQNNYKGQGTLVIANDLEDSDTVFNLTSDYIYRNETWQNGELVQDSFEFRGTGRYRFTSTGGSSFDINLDEFVLKEQNNNRTDYRFSGSGAYTSTSVTGTIEIDYKLLGLEVQSNWAGVKFTCEKYRIETIIEYEISGTPVKLFNSSQIWVVADKTMYEETTIFVEYYYFYSLNGTPQEVDNGTYHPQDAPQIKDPESNVLTALDFDDAVPVSFNIGDSVKLFSSDGIILEYSGTAESDLEIGGETMPATTLDGEILIGGTGNSTIIIVNSGQYSGWVIEKEEQYFWNKDRFQRQLVLINN
jgi:PKD repeat protein